MPTLTDPGLTDPDLAGASLLHNQLSPTSNILNASLHTAGRIAAYIFPHNPAGISRPDDIDAHNCVTAYEPVHPGAV